jgi:shikimate kinase
VGVGVGMDKLLDNIRLDNLLLDSLLLDNLGGNLVVDLVVDLVADLVEQVEQAKWVKQVVQHINKETFLLSTATSTAMLAVAMKVFHQQNIICGLNRQREELVQRGKRRRQLNKLLLRQERLRIRKLWKRRSSSRRKLIMCLTCLSNCVIDSILQYY